ncbi:MAG: polysaccharide biosynthesis/export family protein [Acidobacteriota bacterium]
MLWTTRVRGFCRRHPGQVLGLLLSLLQITSVLAVDDYIVGPNDVLNIAVFEQPQLTGKYLVQSDGMFTFPLLGRLKAGGLTMQVLENDLRDRLIKGGFLKQPQVSVSVDQYRSQQIFVMGEVRQPGTLQFTGSMSIIEALARVGSTTERAGMEAVILRAPAGGAGAAPDAAAIARAQNANDANIVRVNLQNLQGALSQNIDLRAGDTIFVPRAETVFVSGQVRSAGEYVIRKGMTVRQVLTLAGGVTERGSTRRIQIIRSVNGADTTVPATLQDTVRTGDTIVVRESLF